jgi:hypothetical protein
MGTYDGEADDKPAFATNARNAAPSQGPAAENRLRDWDTLSRYMKGPLAHFSAYSATQLSRDNETKSVATIGIGPPTDEDRMEGAM